MLKTVKQACTFNEVVHNYRMAEGIENLADLILDEGDGRDFFERNYVTNGMGQLFHEGMLRLSSKSDQAVFELSQAMGGGKTHMMIALGLLARHEHLRPEVLDADLNARVDFDQARIAAFNGRNNPDNYLWGDIATQLGEAEAIKEYWANGPKPVDQAGWKRIIGDKPTLIMLDELPPYLNVAATTAVGGSTLADIVVYTLGTLMSAALELPNCLIIIANLSGSYGKQSKALADAISNLSQETRRQAQIITPVQLNGNEIYEILKKRLITKMPDESVINEVAEEFAAAVKKAEKGGYITATSLEQIADQVRETYPFHPSFKHLVALFKENEGFRQTRGLMQFSARLLKSVDQRENDDVYLVGAQHLDLNDSQVRDEIQRIAPNLQPAVSRDLADGNSANAEKIDLETQSDAASQVGTLLLAASLSRTVGGRIGLSEGELIEFLAAPNRKADEFRNALERLREVAWYLHREEERYFVKETENLTRQIERNAKDIPPAKIDQALSKRLQGILEPRSKLAYQQLEILPKLDTLKLRGHRVLVVVRPDSKIPPAELANFFDYQEEKNNLLVLSGEDSHMADAVELRLRELYAIEKISARLKPADTAYEEARDKCEEAEDRFAKALSSAYNRLYFPTTDTTDNSQRLLPVTIDNGLRTGDDEHSAEHQIEQLLADPRANYKLQLSLKDSYQQYWAMAEDKLWPKGADNRRTPWKDVQRRAQCDTSWPWMPGARGLDDLKNEALKQARWREHKDGYLEKGPFPKDKTTLNIISEETDQVDKVMLTLTPRHAGDGPVVHFSGSADVSAASPVVDNLDNFSTDKATLYFMVRDPSGAYETGEVHKWVAELKIRHQVVPAGDKRQLVLQSTPSAKIRYTLDGTGARDGELYSGPVDLGPEGVKLLVFASAAEASASREFNIPASGDSKVELDPAKPAQLNKDKRVSLDSTEQVYGVLNAFKGNAEAVFRGVKIELGEGETAVTLQFRGRDVTADMIEAAISSLREVLGEQQANVVVGIRGGAEFANGFDANAFAQAAGIRLQPGDIQQD